MRQEETEAWFRPSPRLSFLCVAFTASSKHTLPGHGAAAQGAAAGGHLGHPWAQGRNTSLGQPVAGRALAMD